MQGFDTSDATYRLGIMKNRAAILLLQNLWSEHFSDKGVVFFDSPSSMRTVKKLWDEIDTDRDGRITASEFRMWLRCGGGNLGALAPSIFSTLDKSRRGYLTFNVRSQLTPFLLLINHSYFLLTILTYVTYECSANQLDVD